MNFAATATANTNVTPQDIDQDIGGGSTTTTSSFSASASAVSGGTSASSTFFADGDSGVLRAFSTMAGNNGDGTGDGNTSASGRISETYSLTGSGTLTASLKLDGDWDLTRTLPGGSPGLPFWQVQSSVSIGVPARDFICLGTSCSPSSNTSNSGSISDHILSVSQAFSVGTSPLNVDVEFFLLTQIGAGNGIIDFGNTAKLLVTTSGGLVATPSDPDFISTPAFFENSPSPVPLPAGLALLLSGILGLGLLKRSKATTRGQERDGL